MDSVDLFFHSRHAAAQHITIESNVVGQRRDGLLLLCQERILALALCLRLSKGFLETDDLLLQTAHIGAAFGIRLDEPLYAEDPPCVIGQRRTLEIALGKLGLDELQEERGQLRRRRCRIEAVDLRPDGRRFRETRQGCARRLCIASERWLRKHDERRDAGSVTRVVAISCGSALEKRQRLRCICAEAASVEMAKTQIEHGAPITALHAGCKGAHSGSVVLRQHHAVVAIFCERLLCALVASLLIEGAGPLEIARTAAAAENEPRQHAQMIRLRIEVAGLLRVAIGELRRRLDIVEIMLINERQRVAIRRRAIVQKREKILRHLLAARFQQRARFLHILRHAAPVERAAAKAELRRAPRQRIVAGSRFFVESDSLRHILRHADAVLEMYRLEHAEIRIALR